MPITKEESACLKLLDCLWKMENVAKENEDAELIEDIDKARDFLLRELRETPHGLAAAFVYLTTSGVSKIPQLPLNPESALKFLKHNFGEAHDLKSPLTKQAAKKIFAYAFLGTETWEYARRVCITELRADRELPPPLTRYASYALSFPKYPKRRGRSGTRDLRRNLFIWLLDAQLRPKFDLPFTRSPTSSNDSICSVIAEAMGEGGLTMTEDAIRKVIAAGPRSGKK